MNEEPILPPDLRADLERRIRESIVNPEEDSGGETTLTESDLRRKLDGQLPVILAIDDVPEKGSVAYVIQLGRASSATMQLNAHETLQATSIRMRRQEAMSLAVQLTELLGPLDYNVTDVRDPEEAFGDFDVGDDDDGDEDLDDPADFTADNDY